MFRKICFTIVSLVCLAACKNATKEDKVAEVPTSKDVHTLSNADSVTMKHLFLDIKVDFDTKKIAGKAVWDIDNKDKVKTLKLDTYDLTIDSVVVDGNKVQFSLDSMIQYLGSRLNIPINDNSKQVAVYYKTGDHARALQWLDPQQTSGKKHPFLYTQSESIYARSWIPCADGPGIRYTYDARVTVPKGSLALMSAQNPQQTNDSGIYHFKMELPIPAYLMALAVGDIQFRSIDARTGVYAEPTMIDKVQYEFADVGKMVTAAEKLYGPYRWGRYDVLVLPPGFPIGGMENPRLTFATPTVIAGDRSLVDLVAHELAHSWSGNLVTNATWDDFWMNEGFTNYFERRITEEMNGKSFIDMSWELGYQTFEANVKDLGADSKDTWLKLDLKGRDPDAGLTDIPYEKGSHFLKLIENTVGRKQFDTFLRKYFDEHAFKTITTEQFLDYMDKNLLHGDSELYRKIDVKAWVYGPGIPANCPRTNPVRFKKVDSLAALYGKTVTGKDFDTKNWCTFEWLEFLHKMPDSMSLATVKQLDNDFHFSRSGNSEVIFAWFMVVLDCKDNYPPAMDAMERFLSTVGRRKFIEPLYAALVKRDPSLAKSWYQKYRQNYHPLAQESLDKIVNNNKGT
jgi:leukotriene A-4 hydrolase/aminopeptidase